MAPIIQHLMAGLLLMLASTAHGLRLERQGQAQTASSAADSLSGHHLRASGGGDSDPLVRIFSHRSLLQKKKGGLAGLARGVDTTGGNGGCEGLLPGVAERSHWCQVPVPGKPSSKHLKYGRHTTYENFGKGWCGMDNGSEKELVPVAISTKYMRGTSPNSPYCNQCVCVRITGPDTNINAWPTPDAKPYYGKIFKGRVMDSCPECSCEMLDVLGCEAYYNVVPEAIAKSVGVFTQEWQLVDCKTDCNAFFKGL